MSYKIGSAAKERLETMLPNAQEEILDALIMQCADEFMAICNRDDVPARADHIIEQMVAFRYSQLSAEGLASQSFSGMSEAYMSDYPERMKRAMYQFRRLSLR